MRTLEADRLPALLPALHRAATAICGCPREAEDLVQETLVRALARPRILRGGDELRYLIGALRNTHVSGVRSSRRRPQTSALPDDFGQPSPVGDPEAALDRSTALEAIGALPREFSAALVAVDLVGLSYREAARALGTPESTVASRLFRARERVATAVGQRSG